MAIGDTIRTAREKLGWTRAQLSAKVGVDPSAISRIESGDRLPGPDVADGLESALGLRRGTLAKAVIAEKRKRRDRVRQLKRLVYNSHLSVEEIRRRLAEGDPEQNK
jgi:ribosome-binding protein aMBF1 (putative translation factor)